MWEVYLLNFPTSFSLKCVIIWSGSKLNLFWQLSLLLQKKALDWPVQFRTCYFWLAPICLYICRDMHAHTQCDSCIQLLSLLFSRRANFNVPLYVCVIFFLSVFIIFNLMYWFEYVRSDPIYATSFGSDCFCIDSVHLTCICLRGWNHFLHLGSY